ncbi:MAG TPA: 3-dehydroquinate synthase [Lentimicrobium sp.]|nr:3-dehydroquinate synthase [Lentimicrobium sp.]
MSKKLRTIEIAGSPVYLGHQALSELGELIRIELSKKCEYFILVDTNTQEHCLPPLIRHLPELSNAKVITVDPGEENKTIQTCEVIWTELAKQGANRNSTLINLGGGVITDIGGFVASTFHRGMTFINIPTTLMSMIDAALGGKTGVDLLSLKNIVGLFSHPQAVYVWPDFIKTLPHRFILSGYAEMLKHALIADPDFWKQLYKFPMALVNDWSDLIYHAALIKCRIVNSDPFETGYRRLLNFGHTIGHAFETYSLRHDETPLSHGEAVAMGIICESYISYRLLDLPHAQRDEIIRNILMNFDHYNLQTSAIPELVDIIMYDKKNRDGKIVLSLIKEIGKGVDGQECDAAIVRESLFRYTDFRRHVTKSD